MRTILTIIILVVAIALIWMYFGKTIKDMIGYFLGLAQGLSGMFKFSLSGIQKGGK
jgi:uncharacterized membrane protein